VAWQSSVFRAGTSFLQSRLNGLAYQKLSVGCQQGKWPSLADVPSSSTDVWRKQTMRTPTRGLPQRFLSMIVYLFLSFAAASALAVPKAAEHEDAEVTFGEAIGAPPKTTNKNTKQLPAAPATVKADAKAAGKGTKQVSTAKRTKNTAKSQTGSPPGATKAVRKTPAPSAQGKAGKK